MEASSHHPIGVFDSGVGGLTVVRELLRQLPDESVLYVGDTARVPYGPRGADTITRFALEMVQFLLEQGVKALVVGCNSIAAASISAVRQLASVPVIDVIGPTVRDAVAATTTRHVGVIGTAATVASGVYGELARALDAGIRVDAQACPLLVPIAEEGLAEHPVASLMAEEYVGRFRQTSLDVLILGCTHYPLFKPVLREALGPRVRLVDSAGPTIRELATVLDIRGLRRHGAPRHRFCVTDASYKFLRVATSLLGWDPSELVEQVAIELPPGEGLPACLSVPPLLAAR
jgi:glutamate racemase